MLGFGQTWITAGRCGGRARRTRPARGGWADRTEWLSAALSWPVRRVVRYYADLSNASQKACMEN